LDLGAALQQLVSHAEPIKPLRFSTGRQEPARELRLLNERKIVLPLEPLAGAAVHANIRQWRYPRLGILSATLRGLRHGSSDRAVHDDDLYLGITLKGSSVAEQRRAQLTLLNGDAVLLSGQDTFRMIHPDQVSFLGIRLSRAVLGTHLNDIDDAVMRLIARDTPPLSLLARYVTLAINDSLPTTSELRQLVVDHVYELAAMAIDATRERALITGGLGVRAARLRAMKADIVASLADSNLSVAAIAARHQVTSRYVHKLFAYEGTTYSEFVVRQRLARVHRMLTDPRFAGESISALAFRTGFNDLSYFNRAFRQRYRATPSDVRRDRTAANRPSDHY